MEKSIIASFDAFKEKVKNCKVVVEGELLKYVSIYGDSLSFHMDYSQAPSINGQVLDYNSGKAFESPFLTGEWNEGRISIRKGDLEKTLIFQEP